MKHFKLNLLIITLFVSSLLNGQKQALIFAVEEYRQGDWETPHAIEEAIALGAVLGARFNFQVEVVENPTSKDIIRHINGALQQYYQPQSLGKGQMLIYFLGRGEKEEGQAYFLPADTSPDSLSTTALLWQQLIAEVSRFMGQHLLVVADADYCNAAGSWDKTGLDLYERKFSKRAGAYRNPNTTRNSRIFLPLDPHQRRRQQGPSYTHALRDGLNWLADEYDKASMYRLQNYLVRWAGGAAKAYGFRGDDESSNFLLVSKEEPKRKYFRERAPENVGLWHLVQEQNSVEAYSFFAKQYPESSFARKALIKLEESPDTMVTADGRVWQLKSSPSLLAEDGLMFVRGGKYTSSLVEGPHWDDNNKEPLISVGDFYISLEEVAFSEYKKFCKDIDKPVPDNPYWWSKDGPAVQVDWYDAIEYCNWLSRENGLEAVYEIDEYELDANNCNLGDDKKWVVTANWKADGYRLPTAAEWEFAACQYAQKGTESGLHRMGRAVQEWCWDWEGFGYLRGEENSSMPIGPEKGAFRALRGIASDYHEPERACGYAYAGPADWTKEYIGFRVVRRAD